MRALVTGDTGFAGRHLAGFLLKKGVETHGVSSSPERGLPWKHRALDLTDGPAVKRLVKAVRPDRVYHLAAQSSGAVSWKRPVETVAVNYAVQLNLLEAVRTVRPGARVHVASSSEVYGKAAASLLPAGEATPLRPASPYGVSKELQELLAVQYWKNYGVHTLITRAFPHTGPGQAETFAAPDFARQIARIEKGKQPPLIRTGNLSAVRDFTDVRDVVRAYWLALEKGRPGEAYNVCSGKGVSIGAVLDILLASSRAKVRVVRDPARLRPSDVPRMTGDGSKLARQTGWKPRAGLNAALADLLNDWRRKT